MQRHLLRALAATIYPLLGLAAAMALTNCAGAPSPDNSHGLAQRMNIVTPTVGDGASTTAAK